MSADEAAREETTASRAGSSEELARVIAGIVDDKLGEEIVALDVSSLVGYTDVLMVCTLATSGRRRRSTTRCASG